MHVHDYAKYCVGLKLAQLSGTGNAADSVRLSGVMKSLAERDDPC